MLDLTQQTPSVRWRAEEEQLGSWEDPAGSELLHFSFAVPLLALLSSALVCGCELPRNRPFSQGPAHVPGTCK